MTDHRKVDDDIGSPIDGFFYNISDKMCPYLRECGMTPNDITTVGLIVGLIAVYFIYSKKYLLGLLFFWLCFFSDCMDGHYARKYNMTTKFGDYYDHFRDIFITTLVIILLFFRIENKAVFVTIVSVFLYLMLMHIGCQELQTKFKEHSDCLKPFCELCPDPSFAKYARYFGCGTFILMLSCFILQLYVY